jgi:hypothetical protein
MSGCHAVCQIDTRIRPDRALAQAWGLENFAQQSTVADTLDCFTDCGVQQLRTATGQIYFRDGKAPRHNYAQEGHLILDIDLTGLPASQPAEGSTKVYFSGKKGGTGDNWHASVLLSTMKRDSACYTPAIKHQSTACAPPLKS